MDIKKIIFLFFIFLTGISAVNIPGTEDQRKYAVPDIQALDSFIVSSNRAGNFITLYEGAYTYYDIYLDTPDFDLYKNNLSLRFRKKIIGSEIFYSLQLKSEMDTGSSVRMEVEEAELSMYRVKDKDKWVPLIYPLNVLFAQLQSKNIQPDAPNAQYAISQIQEWIKLKIEGPVAPFQKLSHLKLKGLDTEKLKTLSPVIYGSDTRKRSHVYFDTSSVKTEPKYIRVEIAQGYTIPSLIVLPSYVWTMETSLDAAVFYPIIKSKTEKILISEFEVENKHPDPAKGSKLMDEFETWMMKEFKLTKNKDSKYCNSIKAFW